MLIHDLVKDIHQNAVDHGWWEEKRSIAEIIALIHSEWSEALEEARAGRPNVYQASTLSSSENGANCTNDDTEHLNSIDDDLTEEDIDRILLEDRQRLQNELQRLKGAAASNPVHKDDGKPEGIAVELIDGCIRIFDFMGDYDLSLSIEDDAVENVEDLYANYRACFTPTDTAELIADLHNFTSLAYDAFCNDMMEEGWMWMAETLIKALSWVKGQGLDPLGILLMKHEYNKGRPYKHGKKF